MQSVQIGCYTNQHKIHFVPLTADDLFGLNIVNSSTGEKITAEGCRLAGLPANQGNEAAYSLAWTVLVGYYQNTGNQPDDSMFS